MIVLDFDWLRASRQRLATEDAEHHRRAARRALMWARLACASERDATARRAARRIRQIYERECALAAIGELARAMERRAERLKRRGPSYVQLERAYPGIRESVTGGAA